MIYPVEHGKQSKREHFRIILSIQEKIQSWTGAHEIRRDFCRGMQEMHDRQGKQKQGDYTISFQKDRR